MHKIFKIFLVGFVLVSLCSLPSYSGSLAGKISEEHVVEGKQNTVYDAHTGVPIPNATVGIPSKGMYEKTDANGHFALKIKSRKPIILSVQAPGYKPFSLTVTETGNPLKLALKKIGKEIIIDSQIRHLGDNNFSPESANAGEFRLKSAGPVFSKTFFLNKISPNALVSLKIGSIIGLDTELARRLNQSGTHFNYSSPVTVYINNKLIGEIKINGDNQELQIPVGILKSNNHNDIIVHTGKNLFVMDYPDYDDMEFINLILELR